MICKMCCKKRKKHIFQKANKSFEKRLLYHILKIKKATITYKR